MEEKLITHGFLARTQFDVESPACDRKRVFVTELKKSTSPKYTSKRFYMEMTLGKS